MACVNKPVADWTIMQEMVHRRLVHECSSKHSPASRLSSTLKSALDSMHPEARGEVVERKHIGCAPLYLASKRGNLKIVEYLVRVCGADLEQCGVDFDHPEQNVSPLWSAAAAGHLSVVRVLAYAGADLNATTCSGSTPVSAACQNNKSGVVTFLANNGADINRHDNNGETCLMKSVHCPRLCFLLINRVDNINARNINNETALHFSVRRKNINTMIMLLDNGADPHARSKEGDDALQLACLVGATPIVDLLINKVHYLPERLADTYELLAAILLENYNFVEEALSNWSKALVLRVQSKLPKRPIIEPRAALQFAREFRNEAELAAAATHEEALHTQALLVFERLLSSHHRFFSDQLMKRGLEYANAFEYQRCVDLWTWALEVRLQDSLTDSQNETCVTARELTRLFQDMHASHAANAVFPRFQDVFHAFSLLTDFLPAAHQAFDIQTDSILIFILHPLHLLLTIVEEVKQEEENRRNWTQVLYEKLCWLVSQDVSKVTKSGNTLLHLSVLQLDFIRGVYFSDEQAPNSVFPSLPCVRALLAAGASVNSTDSMGSSPLLVAARPENFCLEIVQELLETGALLDQRNGLGDTPFSLLSSNSSSQVPLMRYRTLESLAASTILNHHLEVPKPLQRFVEFHRGSFRDERRCYQ